MRVSDVIDRIRLPFRKEKESYSRLYAILGFYPRNIGYYQQALVHKSANQDKGNKLANNERLEFLGDAILDAVVGDIVYQHFKGKREGFLTNARSKMVQRETLNRVAKEIGLNNLIQASISNNSSHNSYMGGNAFEALVGAIYLDRGYDYCMQFMQKRILGHFIDLEKIAYQEVNFKSKLIEWGQKNKVNLTFDLLEQNEEAGSSSPEFLSIVRIEGVDAGKGKGFSKKESQQNASKETLALLKRKPQLLSKIFKEKNKRTVAEGEPVATLDATVKEPQPIVVPTEVEQKKPAKQVETTNWPSEFDLSDISLKAKELSRDEIIAQAEEAAFRGEE